MPLAAIASFEAVQPLMQSMQLYDSTTAAGARLFELIDAPPAVVEPTLPAVSLSAYDIVVRGLDFRYAPALSLVLGSLDLSIPGGGSLGLVGPSGAGKSTLVDLLQHVHVFNATIRDNLAVGMAEASDEQMVVACRIAQIHDFIETLPQGYATRIGEDGLLLSGGERQRLAIARAVLKDAPILILDEATANLDPETEERLMDVLSAWMVGRTTLIISHRRAVAERAARVMELQPPT